MSWNARGLETQEAAKNGGLYIYVQAWSRPYIRSFDLIYAQVDLIYLTLDLIYQILTIYLKTDFCPIWRVIMNVQIHLEVSYNKLTFKQ